MNNIEVNQYHAAVRLAEVLQHQQQRLFAQLNILEIRKADISAPEYTSRREKLLSDSERLQDIRQRLVTSLPRLRERAGL